MTKSAPAYSSNKQNYGQSKTNTVHKKFIFGIHLKKLTDLL